MFRKTLTAAIAVATISGAALFSTTTASQAGYGYHGGYYNSGYSYGYKHYHHAPKPYYFKKVKVWTHYGYVWKKIKVYY